MGVMSVDLRKMRFTHNSIRSTFSDGKSFSTLIGDLRSGKVHPLRHPKLVLDYVRVLQSDTYHSFNNRRLHCLKKFQEGQEDTVYVKVNVVGVFNDQMAMSEFTTKEKGF